MIMWPGGGGGGGTGHVAVEIAVHPALHHSRLCSINVTEILSCCTFFLK